MGEEHNIHVVFIACDITKWDKAELIHANMKKRGITTHILVVSNQFSIDVHKAYQKQLTIFSDMYSDVIPWINEQGICVNLRELNPDYVFYPAPYPQSYPKEVSPQDVIQFSKTCYIPYALPGTIYWINTFLQYELFFKNIYLYFTDTRDGKSII